jgi:hypothetical protein
MPSNLLMKELLEPVFFAVSMGWTDVCQPLIPITV